MSFSRTFLDEVSAVCLKINADEVEQVARVLLEVRERGGRLFLIGSGGGAGHASHAACDFRKLAGFDALCPSDNVSELTARINDEGWESSLSASLLASRLCDKDAVFVFSVGGGDRAKAISVNLVHAIDFAKSRGAAVVGVVGRSGGHLAASADACLVVPNLFPDHVTPLTESFQAVVWHLLVSHPLLQTQGAKWESTQ